MEDPGKLQSMGVAELDVIEELAICPSELLSHFTFMYTLVGLFN